MKKIFITFSLLFFSINFLQADLIDIYKKGTIKLTPDEKFGREVNWNKIFYSYNQVKNTQRKKSVLNKSLAIGKDGSIFVSNSSYFRIYKFDKDGNFDQNFADNIKKNSPSNNRGNRRVHYLSIHNGNTLLAAENNGRIRVYDDLGNLLKTIKVDYMIHSCQGLKNNKIAILGYVAWKGKKSKIAVFIMDYSTEKTKEIFFYFQDYTQGTISLERTVNGKKYWTGISSPHFFASPILRATVEGDLLIGQPSDPKIKKYLVDEDKIIEIDLNLHPSPFDDKEKEKYLSSIKNSNHDQKTKEVILKKIQKNPHFFPATNPLLYNILIDPKDNILVFTYRDIKEYSIRILTPDGKFISDTLLNTGSLSTQIGKRRPTMAFYQNQLFGLFTDTNKSDSSLKLYKTSLSY